MKGLGEVFLIQKYTAQALVRSCDGTKGFFFCVNIKDLDKYALRILHKMSCEIRGYEV